MIARGLLLSVLLVPVLARAEGQLDVEVILFRHVNAVPVSRTAPSENAGYDDLRPLVPTPSSASGVDANNSPREFPHWTTLPDTMLRLGPQAKALARAGTYELLLHTGWRQPVNARHRVRLTVGEPPVLDGSLQLLGGGRKMQVVEDLTLVAGEHQERVRLTQQMRAGELRYVDNPALGLLIQASPVNSAAQPDSGGAPAPTPSPEVDNDLPAAAPDSSGPQPGPAD